MGRKVFISFLGTNNYLETYYEYTGLLSKPVRFIQEALIGFLCKEWSKDDRIFIFCTDGDEGSKKKNWLDNGQENAKNEIEKIGLQTKLQQMNLLAEVKDYTIPEGFSESEIWEIFDCVYEKLEPNDEIYFDVTNAFRSIPLFSTVLFNYSQYMKSTHIKSIFYGAFEKLGPAYKVREMDLDKRVAPVLDLTNIVKLQEMTETANALSSFGRIKKISNDIKSENNIGKINQAINRMSKAISNLDDYITTNRMTDIEAGKYMVDFKENIKYLVGSSLPNPIRKIIERLNEELVDFKTESSLDNVKAAIYWANKFDMMPQAYTLGQEYIISLAAKKLADKNPYLLCESDNEFDKIKAFREYVSSILGIRDKDIIGENFDKELSKFRDLTNQILEYQWVIELRKYYGDFTSGRIIIDHAKGTQSAQSIKKIFNDNFDNCLIALDYNYNVDKSN